MEEAMLASGYSETYAKAPSILRSTKGYQKIMKPIIQQLENERQRVIDSMSTHDLSEESYETKRKALDTLTKNVQLLSGKPTSIEHMNLDGVIDAEVIDVIEEAEQKAYERLTGNKTQLAVVDSQESD